MKGITLSRSAVGALLGIVSLGLGPSASLAQVAYDVPGARVVVLGLRRWTLAMLQDSIRKNVPGQELQDAACMVTLRGSLHFVEASVNEYHMGAFGTSPAKRFLVVKVIEPQDSQLVRWDVRLRNEFSSLRPDYASVVLPVTDTLGDVWRNRLFQWLQYYRADSTSRSRATARVPASGQADAGRLWTFLDLHRSEADRARAQAVLGGDGFYVNRLIASAVLLNFGERDDTWWSLVRVLRDPHEAVRGAAQLVLTHLPDRQVDWTPVAADLRLLVGGTNLPAIQTVFETLVRTSVSPTLAATLLHANGIWVLDHLGAEYPGAQLAAHQLLVRLNNGKDLGATRKDWETWVAAR